MRYIILATMLVVGNLYASDLDFSVKARIEKFQIDHDGDYIGKGQVTVDLFRNNMDPNVMSSFTDLDLGQESCFSISSGELFIAETYPNSDLGYSIRTLKTSEDLETARFDIIVSEVDTIVVGISGTRWDDEAGFPLVAKKLDFNLSPLLKDDVDHVTYEDTLNFPEEENKVLIKIRFSKVLNKK